MALRGRLSTGQPPGSRKSLEHPKAVIPMSSPRAATLQIPIMSRLVAV